MTIRRIFAFLIDAIVAGLIALIPVFGGVISFLYMLLRDGMTPNGSVGKKLLNLQVTTTAGQRLTYAESISRNIIFAIPSLIAIIPLIGWLIGLVVALLIYVVELLAMSTHPQGRRFGDRWANTIVREAAVYYRE